jgi:hypothetical protein
MHNWKVLFWGLRFGLLSSPWEAGVSYDKNGYMQIDLDAMFF